MIKITNIEEWVYVDKKGNIAFQDSWEELRALVFKRDKYTCAYCGTKEGPMEADHVMPKSRGGEDSLNNLVCACRACNRAKKDRTPEEWGWKGIGSISTNPH